MVEANDGCDDTYIHHSHVIDEKEDNNDITMITDHVISNPKLYIGAESTEPPPNALGMFGIDTDYEADSELNGLNDDSTDEDEDFDIGDKILPCDNRWTQSYEVKMENDYKIENDYKTDYNSDRNHSESSDNNNNSENTDEMYISARDVYNYDRFKQHINVIDDYLTQF